MATEAVINLVVYLEDLLIESCSNNSRCSERDCLRRGGANHGVRINAC